MVKRPSASPPKQEGVKKTKTRKVAAFKLGKNQPRALAIILAVCENAKNVDWHALSEKLGEGVNGSLLYDEWHTVILPALRQGRTPWIDVEPSSPEDEDEERV